MKGVTSVENRQFEPTLWADLAEHLQDMHFVSMALDASGHLYVLGVSEMDYRSGSSAKITTKTPHDFVIVQVAKDYVARYVIKDAHWNYHYIQPLPDDELLLVCARSGYYGRDEYDLNGRVFSLDGELKRQFLLGDGIQDVQTTRDGHIWTSYFDEGVFGNHGWLNMVDMCGLIKWDASGNKQFAYTAPSPIDTMADCYALNVVSDTETWLYYYTNFPLVQLKNQRVLNYWLSPVAGSSAFAIWENYVVFCGTYKQPNSFHLLELGKNHAMTPIAQYSLMDDAEVVTARGNRIVLYKERQCYYVDLEDLIFT